MRPGLVDKSEDIAYVPRFRNISSTEMLLGVNFLVLKEEIQCQDTDIPYIFVCLNNNPITIQGKEISKDGGAMEKTRLETT